MTRMPELTVRPVHSIASVDQSAWNALDHGDSPFLEHAFLRALEDSASVGVRAGWEPVYLLAETSSPVGHASLVGAVAGFVKSHSFGEYIFDFAWARASHRAGIPYFPKLVVAAPMTPATGPRLLVAPGAERERVQDALVAALHEVADARGCSSIHLLFVTDAERRALERRGFAARSSLQFHWQSAGYDSFDDFTSALVSRKRKQIRKERRRARAAIDRLDFVSGDAMTGADVAALDRFYRATVAAHGGMDYLRPGFFERYLELAPGRVRFARAVRDDLAVAGALFLEKGRALYGRYWGADVGAEFLHFEVAYYAAIEHCIARGLEVFEAGAQGEHKLLRGFSPVITNSAHWIRDPDLSRAVSEFLAEEARAVSVQARELRAYLPYKQA